MDGGGQETPLEIRKLLKKGSDGMSTALVISLGAVAISLFTVFVALRGAKAKKQKEGDGGTGYDASGSNDCSVSDGGGCDGGGGGGGD